MPDSTPPRRPPFGYGKTGSAKPKPDFEVVDDEPAYKDFEVVEEAPKKTAPAPKQAKRVEPEPVEAEELEPEPAKPRKAKKKKKKGQTLSDKLLEGEAADQERRDASLRNFEWTVPSVLLGIGVLLSVVGAFGASKGVSGIFTLAALSVFVAIYVPLAICALMVIGVLMGINYGRLWPAILKMAAITFIANGIWLVGEWMRIPALLTFPICCFISGGLFMTQFDLDTWETNASTGVLNVMTFLANLILIGFLVVAASSTSDKGSDKEDDDSPPAETQPDGNKKRDRGDKLNGPANPDAPGGPPPIMNPGDDDN